MAFQYDIPFQVDLSDRVALVTGGNGGIGGMFCRALAACGATVIVLGRNLERCQKVADEINAGGGKADAISGDVTDEAAMLRVKDEIAKKYGGLNILINAAGGAVKSAMVPQDQMADPGEKTFFEVGADDIQKEFDLNMRGTWLPSKIMTPLMIGQQGACVLNVSSMSAFTPLTRLPGYSGAKAAVSNFTQWLAVHFSKVGVRVNAMAPGFFQTAQNQKLLFNPDGSLSERSGKILRNTPMERFGTPDELLGTLLYLLNDDYSSFVTGVVIPIDGGFSAYSGV